MYEILQSIYIRLVNEVDSSIFRTQYHTFTTDNRLTGIIGPRGTGKTTLMLQYIKHNIPNKQDALYVSADHIFFNDHTIYSLVQNLYEHDGVKLFFLDEIHKYDGWQQEIKNIYDAFPKITLVFFR